MDGAAFERGRRVLPAVAEALGGRLEIRQDTPEFRRYALSRGDETLVVDLVRERVAQLHADKQDFDGVAVDPLEEILANKLTALVGRQEERDLVDVYFLEQRGLAVEDALDGALAKDGGCTPAFNITDDAPLPGAMPAPVLRDYVGSLVKRLRRRALPGV